jgi:hypothetical protein
LLSSLVAAGVLVDALAVQYYSTNVQRATYRD